MRIKKMYQGTVPENKIIGAYTQSDTDTYNCNYVNTSLSYSTNETKTGGMWVNNKPIYRKVIQTSTPSNANTWVSVGSVSNLRDLVNMYGWVIASDDRRLSINHPEPSYEITTTILNNQVEMKVSNYWTNRSVNITVEYTKTTD